MKRKRRRTSEKARSSLGPAGEYLTVLAAPSLPFCVVRIVKTGSIPWLHLAWVPPRTSQMATTPSSLATANSVPVPLCRQLVWKLPTPDGTSGILKTAILVHAEAATDAGVGLVPEGPGAAPFAYRKTSLESPTATRWSPDGEMLQ